MICEKYQNLTPVEQIVMVGQIVHAMQNDDEMFDFVKKIIFLADRRGILDNVTILPNSLNQDQCTQTSLSS